jgi:hypothetical protein
MNRRPLAVMGALGLLALVACDPVWSVQARVLAAPPCASASPASPAASASPIAGARVSVRCPGPSVYPGKDTDERGVAQLASVGFLPGCTFGRCSDDPGRSPESDPATPSCEVWIEKEGFASQHHPLGQFCQAYVDDRCYRVALSVTLSPAGTLRVAP